uniref:Uncharacterized protein n=1 Tax=Corethron hystrix TaxID=216773 RepID=A0A6U5EZI8_9STRA|mmetsp:Transcript_20426/g.46383  ORF Transcript_20426/g.46383 Transcript_20426/m.46383 type:complete len:293 (+) Transcript_20426:1105-1983(+)
MCFMNLKASAAQNFVKLKENVLPKLRSVGVQHRILATGRLDQISKAESKQIYTGQKLAGPTANSIVIPKDTANEIEKIVPRLLEENDDTDLVTVNTTQANIKACTNEVHNWISTYSVEPPELLKKPFSSSCAPTSYTPNAKKADMDIISLALSKDTDQHGEDLINRNCKEYGRKKAYGRKYLHKSLLPNCSNDYLKNLMNGCKQPTLDEEEKIKSDFAVRRMINSIKDGSYSENEIIKVFRKKEEQAATQKTRQMSGRRNTTMRQQKEYENFVESKLIFSKGKRQNTLSAVE